MQDFNDKIISVETEEKKGIGFFGAIWRLLSFIGAALTFIRNFIGNTIMVIIIILIVIAYNFASNLTQEVQTVFKGPNQPPVVTEDIDTIYFALNGYIQEAPFAKGKVESLLRELNAGLNGAYSHELIAIEKALDLALKDKKIKTLIFDIQNASGLSMSNVQRLGEKIQKLKAQGKEVVFSALTYSQTNYALASYASKILLDPIGEVGLKGISLSNLYYKGLIDKLELRPYIFRAGHYKSAVEPYIRDNMSDDVKAQYQELANSLWQEYKKELRVRTSLINSEILPSAANYANFLEQYGGDVAAMQHKLKLVDKLIPLDTYLYELYAKNTNKQEARDFSELKNVLSYQDYILLNDQKSSAKNNIYVVYGIGTIMDKAEDTQSFSPDNIIPILNNIQKDKNAKTVIMYLNSPGGTVTAASAIYRKLMQLKANGIEIVVSMNGVAASGAYLISAAADKIYATNTTLTGSIGVFAMALGLDKILNKYGVYQDGVSTNELAVTPIATQLPQSLERIYNLQIQSTYRNFIDTVATARKLDKNNYLEFAEGQVFIASKAKKLGLVDEIGGLNQAIKDAVTTNKLNENNVKVVHCTVNTDENLSVFENIFISHIQAYLPKELSLLILESKKAKVLSNDINQDKVILALDPINAL